MAKQQDDWQVWSGGKTNRACRAGSFVQICPSGTMLLSKELTDKLDKKQPNAVLRYSLIRKQLRIETMTEIIAGSLRWLSAKSVTARLNSAGALRAWALLPAQTTLYSAEFMATHDGQPDSIIVDLSKIIETLPPPKPKDSSDAGSDSKGRARVGKCSECGRVCGVEYLGELKRLKPHNDPTGEECLCRKPEK